MIVGFKHTAFVFHGESLIHRSPNMVQSDMPPGTLVTLLQKALLFLYVETHVGNVCYIVVIVLYFSIGW